MSTSQHTPGCLEFRRLRMVDPRGVPPELQAHLTQCAACQAWARKADAVDARIRDTLNVAVPDGLAERVILRARGKRRPHWQWYGMAASVLVALTLSLNQFFDHDDGPLTLAQAAADHARDEALERGLHGKSDVREFQTVLANFGGKIESPLGPVRYMHYCPIKGHGMGWHIVYETTHGEVTLLLVHGKADEPDVQTLEVDGLKVRVQRAGQGYFAIIAHDQNRLDSATRDMQSKVRWL